MFIISLIFYFFLLYLIMFLRNCMYFIFIFSFLILFLFIYVMMMNMSFLWRKFYGDGLELDGIDDFRVDEDLSSWMIGKG